MEKKQSSVDWLISISMLSAEEINKAREMHRNEIEESYSEGQSEGSNRASSYNWGVRVKEVTAKQYYNETFNT